MGNTKDMKTDEQATVHLYILYINMSMVMSQLLVFRVYLLSATPNLTLNHYLILLKVSKNI